MLADTIRIRLASLLMGSFVLGSLFQLTLQHGRLMEPPARNTMWRFGYKAPSNYNDNELFCGGIGGIVRNRGKCGVCGDPFDGPRIHETGQAMAHNVTARNFFPGSSIDILLDLVANHGGTFKFDMCWRDSWQQKETEDCFEQLELSQGVEDVTEDGFYDLDPSAGTGSFAMSVDLPFNRTCQNCILRWHWKTANNWGKCEDGSERVGCGYQEIYRNCADISVSRNGVGIGLSVNR